MSEFGNGDPGYQRGLASLSDDTILSISFHAREPVTANSKEETDPTNRCMFAGEFTGTGNSRPEADGKIGWLPKRGLEADKPKET